MPLFLSSLVAMEQDKTRAGISWKEGRSVNRMEPGGRLSLPSSPTQSQSVLEDQHALPRLGRASRMTIRSADVVRHVWTEFDLIQSNY